VVRSLEPGRFDGNWTTRRGANLGLAVGDHPAQVTGLDAGRGAHGHNRWTIENQGSTSWPTAGMPTMSITPPCRMLIFLLFALLCLNVFVAFYQRNLKPAARRAVSTLHIAQLIAAELYTPISTGRHEPLPDGPSPTPSTCSPCATIWLIPSRPSTPAPTKKPSRICSPCHSHANP